METSNVLSGTTGIIKDDLTAAAAAASFSNGDSWQKIETGDLEYTELLPYKKIFRIIFAFYILGLENQTKY